MKDRGRVSVMGEPICWLYIYTRDVKMRGRKTERGRQVGGTNSGKHRMKDRNEG